jgi:hypothetical protein
MKRFVMCGIGISVALGQPLKSVGQNWKEALASGRVRGIEAILATVAPEAVIQWDDEVSAVFPTMTRKTLRLPGFGEMAIPAGRLVFSGVEYPEDARAAVGRLTALETTTPGSAMTMIALVVLSSEERIVRSRVTVLDTKAIATECRSIQMVGSVEGEGWPRLRVTYRSWHVVGSTIGSVDWTSILSATDGEMLARTPTALWGRLGAGAEVSDILQATATTDGILVRGVRTQFEALVRCAPPCKVDANVLLAAVR